jgi:uncharacterized protein (DUF1330 family)
MAKAYWIGRIDVHNPDGYQHYKAANPAIIKKFGGRFVVRSGKFEGVEGQSRAHNVVIEFPDYETLWPAIARRNTRRTSSGGRRIRPPRSS